MKQWVLAAVSLMLAGVAAQAGIIDDFQGFAVSDGIHGVNGWSVYNQNGVVLNNSIIADPTDGSNRALNVYNTLSTLGENNYKTATIPGGEALSLRFRFYVPSGNAPDLSVGMSQSAAPREGLDIHAGVRIDDVSGTVGLYAWDNSTADLLASVSRDTWYTVQMDVNNNVGGTVNNFQVSIQGGAYATLTQLNNGGQTEFAFRGATIGNDFVTVDIRGNNSQYQQNTYFDDVALIPEPASIALLAVGALLLRLRRK